MTKNLFSKQQQAQLKLNPYVKTVSAKAITYTDEFKEFLLMNTIKENIQVKFSLRRVLILKPLVRHVLGELRIVGVRLIKSRGYQV